MVKQLLLLLTVLLIHMTLNPQLQTQKVQNAKIVVANGLGYDSWLPKLAKSTNKSAVLVGEDLMNLKMAQIRIFGLI